MHAIRLPSGLYLAQILQPSGPVTWTDFAGNALAFDSEACARYWLRRIAEMGIGCEGAEIMSLYEVALESPLEV